MKLKIIIASLFLFAIVLLSVAAFSKTGTDPDRFSTHVKLMIRDIGHKLLLHAGDSTSRVLPVIELRDGVFQLEFESSFAFMPDSLVSIVRRSLSTPDMPDDYSVNVYTCTSQEIVYGFQISPMKNNIVPCMGRVQPLRCYRIEIVFTDMEEAGTSGSGLLYLFAAIGLSVVAFIGGSYVKKEKKVHVTPNSNTIPIGVYAFYPEERLLKYRDDTTELSDKEVKLLHAFATRQNQLISRDQLLKEVWEDDGVFTGRSLDMFISKLRKKLKNDPSIQIVNIHGKGYKLEVRLAV